MLAGVLIENAVIIFVSICIFKFWDKFREWASCGYRSKRSHKHKPVADGGKVRRSPLGLRGKKSLPSRNKIFLCRPKNNEVKPAFPLGIGSSCHATNCAPQIQEQMMRRSSIHSQSPSLKCYLQAGSRYSCHEHQLLRNAQSAYVCPNSVTDRRYASRTMHSVAQNRVPERNFGPRRITSGSTRSPCSAYPANFNAVPNIQHEYIIRAPTSMYHHPTTTRQCNAPDTFKTCAFTADSNVNQQPPSTGTGVGDSRQFVQQPCDGSNFCYVMTNTEVQSPFSSYNTSESKTRNGDTSLKAFLQPNDRGNGSGGLSPVPELSITAASSAAPITELKTEAAPVVVNCATNYTERKNIFETYRVNGGLIPENNSIGATKLTAATNVVQQTSTNPTYVESATASNKNDILDSMEPNTHQNSNLDGKKSSYPSTKENRSEEPTSGGICKDESAMKMRSPSAANHLRHAALHKDQISSATHDVSSLMDKGATYERRNNDQKTAIRKNCVNSGPTAEDVATIDTTTEDNSRKEQNTRKYIKNESTKSHNYSHAVNLKNANNIEPICPSVGASSEKCISTLDLETRNGDHPTPSEIREFLGCPWTATTEEQKRFKNEPRKYSIIISAASSNQKSLNARERYNSHNKCGASHSVGQKTPFKISYNNGGATEDNASLIPVEVGLGPSKQQNKLSHIDKKHRKPYRSSCLSSNLVPKCNRATKTAADGDAVALVSCASPNKNRYQAASDCTSENGSIYSTALSVAEKRVKFVTREFSSPVKFKAVSVIEQNPIQQTYHYLRSRPTNDEAFAKILSRKDQTKDCKSNCVGDEPRFQDFVPSAPLSGVLPKKKKTMQKLHFATDCNKTEGICGDAHLSNRRNHEEGSTSHTKTRSSTKKRRNKHFKRDYVECEPNEEVSSSASYSGTPCDVGKMKQNLLVPTGSEHTMGDNHSSASKLRAAPKTQRNMQTSNKSAKRGSTCPTDPEAGSMCGNSRSTKGRCYNGRARANRDVILRKSLLFPLISDGCDEDAS